MYQQSYNPVVGTICIIVGLIILFFAWSELLFRFLVGLAGLKLIDYGLHLRRSPTIRMSFRRWFM